MIHLSTQGAHRVNLICDCGPLSQQSLWAGEMQCNLGRFLPTGCMLEMSVSRKLLDATLWSSLRFHHHCINL